MQIIDFENCRAAPAVQEQPEVRLFHWNIVALTRETTRHHLIGYLDPAGSTLRITTAVAALDQAQRSATTDSGRRYLLVGPPCTDRGRRMVIGARLASAGMHGAIDVSSALISFDQEES